MAEPESGPRWTTAAGHPRRCGDEDTAGQSTFRSGPACAEGVFDYDTAFKRNLGWITTSEQNALRHKRIAIGGLGGVGGSYLIALTRLGIGSFALSDLDGFDLSNFNRQYGASTATLGRSKLEVMVEAAQGINPEITVEVFPRGLDENNYQEFLKGADVYLDSLDLFATPLRWKIFDYCHANGIAVVTAAPIGMSSSLLVFTPGSMSPREYFGISTGESVERQIARFLIGVNPRIGPAEPPIEPCPVNLVIRHIVSWAVVRCHDRCS